MANTPNLGLPILSASQASKHVTLNQSLRKLDALCTPFVTVKDKDLNTPPSSPVDGDRYIVGLSPTGAWTGYASKVAYYDTNGWVFYTPLEGWLFYIADEDLFMEYTGTSYVGHPQTQQNLAMLGVNTTADTTNKLAVSSSAILFSNIGNGVQVKVNKNAITDTNSFLFQTGWSGRAEMGCAGSDDFYFKISPDGSSFYTGMRGHKDLHGRFSIRNAARKFSAEMSPVTGAASVTAVGMQRTDVGSLNAATLSGSNLFTQSNRVKYTSAGTAGASCGIQPSALMFWRGNSYGLGGFYCVFRGGIETFQSSCRMFMGLAGQATAIGNVNPSTLLNMVGIGFDSGQTTLRLFTNDGAGVATAYDLGTGFPTTGSQDLYELILSAEPSASVIRYRVERLNGANVVEGSLSSDLPTNSQFLAPHFWLNNGTSSGAVELAFAWFYGENTSLCGSRGDL